MLSDGALFALKRFILSLVALFSMAPFPLAEQNKPAESGPWSGVLVSSSCNADEGWHRVLCVSFREFPK